MDSELALGSSWSHSYTWDGSTSDGHGGVLVFKSLLTAAHLTHGALNIKLLSAGLLPALGKLPMGLLGKLSVGLVGFLSQSLLGFLC